MTRALISQGPIPGKGPVADLDMSTDLGGVILPSPVMTASGCAAAGRARRGVAAARRDGRRGRDARGRIRRQES